MLHKSHCNCNFWYKKIRFRILNIILILIWKYSRCAKFFFDKMPYHKLLIKTVRHSCFTFWLIRCISYFQSELSRIFFYYYFFFKFWIICLLSRLLTSTVSGLYQLTIWENFTIHGPFYFIPVLPFSLYEIKNTFNWNNIMKNKRLSPL